MIYFFVSVTTIPIVLIIIFLFSKNRRQKQKQLRMAQAYERLVKQWKLAVDYSEFLPMRYIGLDRKNRKLVLIDHTNKSVQEQCICLSTVLETRIIHTEDGSQGTGNIWLELYTRNNDKPLRFCFFVKEHDPIVEMPAISRKAHNWKTRLDMHSQRLGSTG